MFLESNRIIVVDNSQDDLNKIAREFNLKGIGCRTILYDGVSFPDEPFTDVRIAFLRGHVFKCNFSGDFSAAFRTLHRLEPDPPDHVFLSYTGQASNPFQYNHDWTTCGVQPDIPSA